MLLAHRTLHYFGEKEHVSLIEYLQIWINVGEKHLSLLVLRLPLGPQEEGFHGIDTQKPVTLTQMPCDVGKLIFMSSSLSIISIDFNSLKTRGLLGPDSPRLVLPVCQAIWTFQ
jgi:hypothetical protein